MKKVNKVLVSLASMVAFSQPVFANENTELANEAQLALNSILAQNIASVKDSNTEISVEETLAKLETQVQTSLLVKEAVKSRPQAPNYRVVIAD